ncbi:MAG: hypothetical protein U5K79_25385 [Cyclobacteriaceae bacterium]|nr:hypothetical protein [Cyclobacteriaceae bacterium]
MENQRFSFGTFFWRITATHMISYFIMGVIASNILNYEEVFNNSTTLRPFDSPWIAAGPALQILRGLVFALALWYFKESFIHVRRGWLKLWGLVVGLCILSTCAAPAGSIEGFIYTTTPLIDHVRGYLEIVPQTGLFAFMLCRWYDHPGKVWNTIAIVAVSLIVLMSFMGVLAASGIITPQ